jgi:hypothetical protein
MTGSSQPTIPAQTFWFQSRYSGADLFFAPNHNLTGIAHCDNLLFGSDGFQGFVIPAFLDSIVSDTRTITVPMN